MNMDFYPMSTAELLDRTIDVYKKSFGKQISFSVVINIILYVVSFVLAIPITLFTSFFLSITGIAALFVFIVPVVILVFVMTWLAVSSSGHILLSRQAFYGHNARLPIKQLPNTIFRILVTLLCFVIFSLPFVAIISLFIYTGFITYIASTNLWVLSGLTILFIVGYTLFFNMFSLCMAVAAFEHKLGFTALMRSWALVRGEFWKIAGIRTLLFFAVIIIYALSIGLFIGAVYMMEDFVGAVTRSAASFAIFSIITFIISLWNLLITYVLLPIDGIFHATLYFNQRIKKEGLDIEMRLVRLEIETSANEKALEFKKKIGDVS